MAVSSCSLLRSAALSPPITAFGMCRCLLRVRHPVRCGGHSILAPLHRHDNSLSGWACSGHSGFSVRFYSVPNLMTVVMEELAQLRSGKNVRAGGKIGVFSNKEFVQDKLEKQVLEKGVLLEFRKDAERVLLAVAEKPDGKKNWMVCDQVFIRNKHSAAI